MPPSLPRDDLNHAPSTNGMQEAMAAAHDQGAHDPGAHMSARSDATEYASANGHAFGSADSSLRSVDGFDASYSFSRNGSLASVVGMEGMGGQPLPHPQFKVRGRVNEDNRNELYMKLKTSTW